MKLTLKLEELAVDSFDTLAPAKPRGTVFGEQCTCPSACTCPGCPTCDATCANTCLQTCDDDTCGGYTCINTCAGGDTCDYATCDPVWCDRSYKYTDCNHICW